MFFYEITYKRWKINMLFFMAVNHFDDIYLFKYYRVKQETANTTFICFVFKESLLNPEHVFMSETLT